MKAPVWLRIGGGLFLLCAALAVLRSKAFPLFPAPQILLGLAWLGEAAALGIGHAAQKGRSVGLGLALATCIALGNWWQPELLVLFGLCWGAYLLHKREPGWPVLAGVAAGVALRTLGTMPAKAEVTRSWWEAAGVTAAVAIAWFLLGRRSGPANQSIKP